jgi:SAM-dependent methyltransferase
MQSNWQQNFFRGIALDMWRYAMTPEITDAEADFLAQVLNASGSAHTSAHTSVHILDAACGNGRHCVALAARGYRMTGIDQSEEFIEEARVTAPEGIRWIRDDLRSLTADAEFDGAFCFGNSFGYFSPEEAKRFLGALRRALKPGARFVLDTGMVAESLLPQLVQKKWYRIGDILMFSENRHFPAESRMEIDYTFIRGGEVETRPTASYLFTAGELCRMHEEAGLKPVHLFGTLDHAPYQIGSPRLLLVSERSDRG